MNELQTKPLVPEWVKKLAEALKQKEFTYREGKIDFFTTMASSYISTEELAEFMWQQILDTIPNVDPPGGGEAL